MITLSLKELEIKVATLLLENPKYITTEMILRGIFNNTSINKVVTTYITLCSFLKRKNELGNKFIIVNNLNKYLVNIDGKGVIKVEEQEDNTLRLVHEYIKAKLPVEIFYSTDAGEGQWVVDVVSDPGFWIGAFPEKEEAITFCEIHNLPYKIVKQDLWA